MKGKSSSAPALRRICSPSVDAEDGSGEGNEQAPQAAVDPADQQGEPKQNQMDRKTQTSFEEAKDVHTQQEQLSPDVAENAADVTGDDVEEKETETEAAVLEGAQDIPDRCKVDLVEESKEPLITSEPEPDDPTERSEPVMSPSELATTATNFQTNETENKDGVDEQDDTDDDDAEFREEKPDEAEGQIGLKDEAAEAAKDATDNPEKSRSAEPHDDSSSILSQNRERFIIKKGDDAVKKRQSRSLRHLKVLQTSVVTQMKW